MKFIPFIIIISLLTNNFLFSQKPSEAGIKFQHGIWSEVLAEAKKQQKPVFVDAFTTWCGPCKWMEKNIFPDEKAGKFYNENFINYELDMEKGEGIAFAKSYRVSVYPTLMFIDADGNMLHKGVGSRSVNEFIALGKDALNPEKQLFTLKKRYDSGDREPVFLRQYAETLLSAYEPSSTVADEYLKTQNEESLLKKSNMDFIYNHANDVGSQAFQLLLGYKEKFMQSWGAENLEKKISNVAMNSARNAAINNEEAKFKLTIEMLQANLKDSEKLINQSTMTFYQYSNNWKKYAEAAEVFVEKFEMNNANELNSVAWTFYKHIDDKALLAKAEKWAAKSISLGETYANSDTHGALLYKLGKIDEAIKKLERAIKLAKKEEVGYAETGELLKKAKAGK